MSVKKVTDMAEGIHRGHGTYVVIRDAHGRAHQTDGEALGDDFDPTLPFSLFPRIVAARRRPVRTTHSRGRSSPCSPPLSLWISYY
jgi:hypothetical protein